MDFKLLKDAPRLLIEAELVPLQGTRFQPTGFPDLGAATYRLPDADKTHMLMLESAQSVANRLESMIWDEANQSVVDSLQGIPYVVVQQADKVLTNSLLEAHRLNSPYILGNKQKKTALFDQLQKELNIAPEMPVDLHRFATVLARYDINCLLHGVFMEKMAGVLRIARALSGFIEAKNISTVNSGGVKNDRVDATGKAKDKGGAAEGYGNVPYHREEYTAEKITAYFSLDLAQIRGYRLGAALEDLLIAIALYKVQRFLDQGLRLRTACDLEATTITVRRPDGFVLPSAAELAEALPALVKAATPAFADPAITVVQYQAEESAKK